MLDEVGVKYEREDWGRGFKSTDDPVFRKINPVGVVPVIDDGDFRLRESNSIVRYLAEKHGRADLYPSDPKARATTGIPGWTGPRPTSPTACGRSSTRLSSRTRRSPTRSRAALRSGPSRWSVLEQHLTAKGPYVMGASFTIGDIPVGLVVNRWFSIDFKKPEFKAVSAYYDRLAERPGYKAHGRNGTP